MYFAGVLRLVPVPVSPRRPASPESSVSPSPSTAPSPASMPEALVYTDGACSGNPGPGGWGAFVRETSGGATTERDLSGAVPHTTNNRMELTAAVEGLRALTAPSRVTVCADSQYVVKGMTEWIAGWQRRGWVNAAKRPVENRDLWEALLAAAARHRVTWQWVKGHSVDPLNQRVDRLAVAAIATLSGGTSSANGPSVGAYEAPEFDASEWDDPAPRSDGRAASGRPTARAGAQQRLF